MSTSRIHPNGRPYGMGKRDWRLMNQQSTCSLGRALAANKFEANIKLHGIGVAMKLAGIEEDDHG